MVGIIMGTYTINMTTTLLTLEMGFKEIFIAFILLLPLVMKIVFVAELNDFIRYVKKHENTGIPKFTWMISIPIISFFYTFYIASKLDDLISKYKSQNYENYGRIGFLNLTNLIMYFIYIPLNESQRSGYSYYSYKNNYEWIIGLYSLFFLFRIISRFSRGIQLYKDIKQINKDILNNTGNLQFFENTSPFSDNANNGQYSGGYNGGHNAIDHKENKLNNSTPQNGEYHNGNLYN